MPFFIVEPEVPRQLGDNTVMDRGGPSLGVSYLEYAFDGWLGDELITAHPAFAATRSLADKFEAAGLSRFSLRDMETLRTDEFLAFFQHRELPQFVELVISGEPGVDDFGRTETGSWSCPSKRSRC